MIKLRDYQQKFVAAIQSAFTYHNSVLGVLPTGAGKCLGKDTPVLMANGSTKKVQDVTPGDLLLGPDGTPRLVMSVCSGMEPLYRIVPTKGDPYVVNESHILSLQISGRDAVKSAGGTRYTPGAIANLSVQEWIHSSKTFKHVAKGWRAPAVRFWGGNRHIPIPPYILGVWLGDGNSRTASICNVDLEVVDSWRSYAKCIGHKVTSEGTPSSPEYRIAAPDDSSCGRGYRSNYVLNTLRKLDLIQNKHIPLRYKASSVHDRRELLAGLLDTDGYLSHNGYDLVFKQRDLAHDTAFLARSLGLAAYVSECVKTCTNTGAKGTYYRISISGNTHSIPCRVARRKASERRGKKDVLRHGISIEPIGEGEYYGFEIGGPDRLFLLGDFTVTHNTVCFSALIDQHKGGAAAVVHRKEIVTQISMALATLGIKHRIVAPAEVVTAIRKKHLKRFGRQFIDRSSLVGVVSVQTLTSKASEKNKELQRWINQVTLTVFDEGHHYVEEGLWAKAVHMMELAKLLFVTATPERADGKGLGAGQGGFAETMIEGPQTYWLIREGYLCGYKGHYFCPPTNLDTSDIPLTKNGDLNTAVMRKRVVASDLVGDVVKHYRNYCDGKRAIVFATDVATAMEMEGRYRAAGISASQLNGATDPHVRDDTIEAFERGDIKVLINVDLFDEGFDVPAVEAVILARPTESLAKFLQMIGRALRVIYAEGYDLNTTEGRLAAIAASEKPYAVVIDAVRNWERGHGMPHWPRGWTMDARVKGSRGKSDTVPQRVCLACSQPYEKFYDVCPACGMPPPPPAERSTPDQVDGDLYALDDEALSAIFEKIRVADLTEDEFRADLYARGVPKIGHNQLTRKHNENVYRRKVLRELVGWWMGLQPPDRTMSEKYKRFKIRFGVDIGTAFTLKAAETDALIARITKQFSEDISV